MANIDLRDPTAAEVGVPGAFQQANTTYTFEIDWASFDGVRELSDDVELLNLPQGFVVLGACIELVEASTELWQIQLSMGGTELVDIGPANETGRRYSIDGLTLVATAVDVSSNNLVLGTVGANAPVDGKQIVTVTGIALHGRG